MATFETAFYQQRREEQNPHTIGTAERYTGESILQREKICKWIEEDQPLVILVVKKNIINTLYLYV